MRRESPGRPMRVLLVAGRFPELSQTFIAAHLVGLLEHGVDAHVLCSAGDARAWDLLPGLAERVRGRVHVHAPRERPVTTASGFVASAPALVREPRSARRRLATAAAGQRPADRTRRLLAGARILGLAPDLIHFEFAVDAVGATWMGDVADCPVVVSLRGYDVNYAGLGQPDYYADVWARADAIHCLGEDLWQRALRRGCPPDLLHRLIPPSVDTRRFRPLPRGAPRAGRLVILTVARLHWKKGVEHGLVAVRALVDEGVPLEYRILGSGPHERAVRDCVHDLGLAGHVRLLGEHGPDRVLTELRGADVLLHPAVSEGFGNAVLEAQAVEVPVVCTDADGLRENVADGETGIVVPRRDPSALAAALRRLADDPELRRRLGAAGRRRVAEKFVPARQIEAFVELYEAARRARTERPALTATPPAPAVPALRR
jgi:glycosyltransferase involved in cell wall biosynthesis